MTDAWTWPWYLSWASILVGAWIFFWGFRVHGEHVWKVWKWWGQAPVSEHQKKLFHEIADKLSRLRNLADSPGSWTRLDPLPWQVEHSRNYEAVKREAKSLVNQISYDEPTHTTCHDYIHLCDMLVSDYLRRDMDEARADVAALDKIGRGLFRFLHDGRSVDRRKIELPDWYKSGSRAMLAEATKAPATQPSIQKSASEQAAEETAKIVRQALANRGPFETSHPRVLAEAKAIAQELDGRLAYVGRVLTEDAATQDNWRSKVGLQRVPYSDLDNDKLAALSDKEREHVRIAVRALAELDRAVDDIISEPDKHTAAHSAGIYKHRATKARVMVQKLITVMEED